jgi:Putative transposase
MTLDPVEFLRRFFLHVLPLRLVRIRHYGLLANRFHNRRLPLGHALLAQQGREQLPLPPPFNCDLWHCPRCGNAMRVVERLSAVQLYFAGFDFS